MNSPETSPPASKISPSSVGVDHRIWVRYCYDRDCTCHSDRGADEISWSARVLDISRGGVNLQLNRHFEPGAILAIELPLGPDKIRQILQVKVVRAQMLSPGKWSLGCTFEKVLGEKDFVTLQIKQPAPFTDDKRAWIRFTCEGERPAQATWLINPNIKIQARVLNISRGGVGLAMRRHCDPGTLLKIELMDASGQTSRPMPIRVVHSTFKGTEDWVIGCVFEAPLSEEDVAALV